MFVFGQKSFHPCFKKNDDFDRPNRSSVDLLDNCKMLDCEEEPIDLHQNNDSKLDHGLLN